MWTLKISCLIHSFLEIVQKKSKTCFSKFQIFRLLIRDSNWLNFINFHDKSTTQYKIRLVSRLRQREDQALISVSTILKFPAQIVKFLIFHSQIQKLLKQTVTFDSCK